MCNTYGRLTCVYYTNALDRDRWRTHETCSELSVPISWVVITQVKLFRDSGCYLSAIEVFFFFYQSRSLRQWEVGVCSKCGVVCWCLCLYVYGGNYGLRNPVLIMWQLIFYLHVSEALVFLAQESQSPPTLLSSSSRAYFRILIWIYNLWFIRSTRQHYFTILFVTELTVCACTYTDCFLIGRIYTARRCETGNIHHLWLGSSQAWQHK